MTLLRFRFRILEALGLWVSGLQGFVPLGSWPLGCKVEPVKQGSMILELGEGIGPVLVKP